MNRDEWSGSVRLPRAVVPIFRIIQQRHQDRNRDRPAQLAVGPREANPGEATMEEVYRWSAGSRRTLT